MAELHIEDVTREAELHMKIRLLPILTDFQRQPTIARRTQHLHSPVVTRERRLHDRISNCPMNRPIGYIDVDRLQAETTLQEAAAKCGFPLEVKGAGAEVRIDCPFGCPCDHSGRKEIAINTENPQKIFQCHSYVCAF